MQINIFKFRPLVDNKEQSPLCFLFRITQCPRGRKVQTRFDWVSGGERQRHELSLLSCAEGGGLEGAKD